MTREDVRVSEVRQTDDSDKVSEVGHVGQDVGKNEDELSEIDDNEISEADMMRDVSHETDEWWWVMYDDELDEISDLWGWRLVEADDLQIAIVILNIILLWEYFLIELIPGKMSS